jgi:carboxymethylenebutenolidase
MDIPATMPKARVAKHCGQQKLMNDFFAAVEFLMAQQRIDWSRWHNRILLWWRVANAAAVAHPNPPRCPHYGAKLAAAEDVPNISAALVALR